MGASSDDINELSECVTYRADQFRSPNEVDRNLESANVVDGLFAIARALNRIADKMHPEAKTQ